jgi:hypothetical protein
MDNGHGYLSKTGFCSADGKCTRFPVVIGEWGSDHSAGETEFLKDFGTWMRNQRSNSWIVWAVNPNSGDTGGLFDQTFWQDIRWDKIRYMVSDLALKPWWVE